MALYIMSWVWCGIGIFGLVTGDDPTTIIGIVSSTVTLVGSALLREIKEQGENK